MRAQMVSFISRMDAHPERLTACVGKKTEVTDFRANPEKM
jgi:hypothetical protein